MDRGPEGVVFTYWRCEPRHRWELCSWRQGSLSKLHAWGRLGDVSMWKTGCVSKLWRRAPGYGGQDTIQRRLHANHVALHYLERPVPISRTGMYREKSRDIRGIGPRDGTVVYRP